PRHETHSLPWLAVLAIVLVAIVLTEYGDVELQLGGELVEGEAQHLVEAGNSSARLEDGRERQDQLVSHGESLSAGRLSEVTMRVLPATVCGRRSTRSNPIWVRAGWTRRSRSRISCAAV